MKVHTTMRFTFTCEHCDFMDYVNHKLDGECKYGVKGGTIILRLSDEKEWRPDGWDYASPFGIGQLCCPVCVQLCREWQDIKDTTAYSMLMDRRRDAGLPMPGE